MVHRGHNRQAVFHDDDDRRRFLTVLDEARVREDVAIHGYALLPESVWLLATPVEDRALGRMMQACGRRYTTAFNRRHARSGTLWDGRFRSTVVAAGPAVVEALVFVEQAPVREGLVQQAISFPWSSVHHHMGQGSDLLITDSPAYWSLGNTPFDRAAAYSTLVAEPLAPRRASDISAAIQRGWALASGKELMLLQLRTQRPLTARRRGRPPSASHQRVG